MSATSESAERVNLTGVIRELCEHFIDLVRDDGGSWPLPLADVVSFALTVGIASPEWARAALIDCGYTPEDVDVDIALRRAWVAEHPIPEVNES